MEPEGGVRVHRHDGVGGSGVICEVVLDRPEAMNALSTVMAARLARVCAEIVADPQVRAVASSRAATRVSRAGPGQQDGGRW